MGSVSVRALPAFISKFRGSEDLSIIRLDVRTAGRLFGNRCLRLPEWVDSRVVVPEEIEEFCQGKRSLQSDMRKILENGLTSEFSRGEKDFFKFYDTMYLPFVFERHGEEAVARNRYWMHRAFRKGGLIWVIKDGRRVAGVLFEQQGRKIRTVALGTLDGEWDWVRQGVNAATDLFILQYARQVGCSQVNMGGSRPCLQDGVLRYKRKWGARLFDKADNWYDNLLFFNRLGAPALSFLSRNPLIFRDGGGLSALKVIQSEGPVGQKEMDRDARQNWLAGLRRFYLVSTGGWQKNIKSRACVIPLNYVDLESMNFLS
jgi:hypothetical protein